MFDAVLNSNKIENPDLASFDRNNFRDMYCNAMPTKAFKMNFSNAP